MTQGVLYIVATPIGNLGDITYRAIQTLQAVDMIACEDTRVSGKLLKHYEIDKPKAALHHHSTDKVVSALVAKMESGESVAYVSDAGTPGVSDPGNILVAAAREKGIVVVPIPGPSAVTALLSIAGINTQTFTFMAYPPHKKGRQTFFTKLVVCTEPVIYYDSVHRVIKNLELLAGLDPTRKVIIGRELTKMFEEVSRGVVTDLVQQLKDSPSTIKGEFVILVEPQTN